MTLTPDNTPPPTPRNNLSTPPPPPRKPRRTLRKRRRPPRESRSPACIVCKRKRPLRHNGLCWSLECALQVADNPDDTPRNHPHQTDPLASDKLSQPQFLHPTPEQTINQQHPEFHPVVPDLDHKFPHDVDTHHLATTTPQLSETRDPTGRHAEEEIDPPSSEHQIRKQENHVDRAEPSAREDATHHVRSESSDTSDESEGNENELIGT